jgi:hypothetical protein
VTEMPWTLNTDEHESSQTDPADPERISAPNPTRRGNLDRWAQFQLARSSPPTRRTTYGAPRGMDVWVRCSCFISAVRVLLRAAVAHCRDARAGEFVTVCASSRHHHC